MPRTRISPGTAVAIPLLLIAASMLPLYVLPSSQTVDKILAEYLHNIWLTRMTKLAFLVLIGAIPFYVYQRSTAPISKKKQKEILDLIKHNTNAKYDLRIAEREAKIESILEDCGARGFTLPQGFTAGDTADLYKSELHIFSELLSSTISEIMQSDNLKMPPLPLIALVEEMIMAKTTEFSSLYIDFIDHYFRSLEKDHKDVIKRDSNAILENDAKLLIVKLSTAIQIEAKL